MLLCGMPGRRVSPLPKTVLPLLILMLSPPTLLLIRCTLVTVLLVDLRPCPVLLTPPEVVPCPVPSALARRSSLCCPLLRVNILLTLPGLMPCAVSPRPKNLGLP